MLELEPHKEKCQHMQKELKKFVWIIAGILGYNCVFFPFLFKNILFCIGIVMCVKHKNQEEKIMPRDPSHKAVFAYCSPVRGVPRVHNSASQR